MIIFGMKTFNSVSMEKRINRYQWCEFKSRRGKKKILTAQRSNSNTVWFNFQTYVYTLINIVPEDLQQR
jgi:hypothetical protein